MNVRVKAAARLRNYVTPANVSEAETIIQCSRSWEDWKIEKMAMKPAASALWRQYWGFICYEYNKLNVASSSSAGTLTGSATLPVYQKPLHWRVQDSLAVMGDLD